MSPLSSSTLKESFELNIESLSYFGGRGVGRHHGVVVFVPFTAPGDLVRVQVKVKKPKFWEAEVLEVLLPSKHRRQPRCPVAGQCGGCTWQHINYDQQIVQKEKILRDSLRRLKGFEWRPFLVAAQEFHYRNRIQLQIRHGQIGFFAPRSRELVPIDQCWIAEKELNQRMQYLTREELSHQKLELAIGEDGQVVAMPGLRDPEAALFSQVNREQNEVLKRETIAAVSIEPDWIMDLYSGSGNLTAPLTRAHPRAQMTAIELSKFAVARGRERLASVNWYAGDVAHVLSQLSKPDGQGLIVLDPPRPGCETAVINQIQRLAPLQILYISCNPTTFARDAERLLETGLYNLEHVRGLDMFPQTEHVELIASFRASI